MIGFSCLNIQQCEDYFLSINFQTYQFHGFSTTDAISKKKSITFFIKVGNDVILSSFILYMNKIQSVCWIFLPQLFPQQSQHLWRKLCETDPGKMICPYKFITNQNTMRGNKSFEYIICIHDYQCRKKWVNTCCLPFNAWFQRRGDVHFYFSPWPKWSIASGKHTPEFHLDLKRCCLIDRHRTLHICSRLLYSDK